MYSKKVAEENLKALESHLKNKITNSSMDEAINTTDSIQFESEIRQPIKEIMQKEMPSHNASLLYLTTNQVANLLTTSNALKKWGQACVDFYNTGTGKLVNGLTGEVSTIMNVNFLYKGVIPTKTYWLTSRNGWTMAYLEVQPDGGPYIREQNKKWLQQQLTETYGSPADPALFKLLSPMHVAAMIGDKDLMQLLIKNGKKIDDNSNFWSISPFEIAVDCGNTHSIGYLLELGASKECINKGMNLAIEKGSFAMIECLIKHNIHITDESLTAAHKRDKDLGDYLEQVRFLALTHFSNKNSPIKAMQSLFDQSGCSTQLMIDLIIQHPTVVSELTEESKGYTLLHWAVTQKKTEHLTSLMSAIFEAGYLIADGFAFDIETQDKANKTVLDLALASGISEMTSAIILYGNPKISLSQQQLIITANIDIPAIEQERKKMVTDTIRKICHLQQKQNQALVDTIQEMIAAAQRQEIMQEKIVQLEQVNINTVKQLEQQSYQMQILVQYVQQIGQDHVMQNNNPHTQPRLLHQAMNPNSLFAPNHQETEEQNSVGKENEALIKTKTL